MRMWRWVQMGRATRHLGRLLMRSRVQSGSEWGTTTIGASLMRYWKPETHTCYIHTCFYTSHTALIYLTRQKHTWTQHYLLRFNNDHTNYFWALSENIHSFTYHCTLCRESKVDYYVVCQYLDTTQDILFTWQVQFKVFPSLCNAWCYVVGLFESNS